MIPEEVYLDELDEMEEIEDGNDNYKLDLLRNRLNGIAKDSESLKQVIFKILNTNRYEHIIYSWDYGIEVNDLYGEKFDYVKIELKRRIEEALLQDDRITSVTDFKFEKGKKNELIVEFIVNTVYGEIEARKEVGI